MTETDTQIINLPLELEEARRRGDPVTPEELCCWKGAPAFNYPQLCVVVPCHSA